MTYHKHRREIIWELAMGLGVVCAGPALAWAGSTVDKASRRRTPNGDWLETAPPGRLPSFALDKSPQVEEAYRFAVDHEDILQYIPCFCGCGKIGHQHNAACYITERHSDGQVTFNSHAVG